MEGHAAMTTASRLTELPADLPTKPKVQRGAIQVYETLREDILWLRISPGSAIDEVALATRFDVSRTPIREALMLLAGDGLVVFLTNRTTIVLPLSLHNVGEFMDCYLLLSRAVVRGAVLNHHAGQEVALKAALAKVLEKLETSPGEPALRADLDLRRLLGEIANNSFQYNFYRQILDAGIRSKIMHFFPNSTQQDRSAIQNDWTKLIGAILARDADAADRIIIAMILAEHEVILRSVSPRYGHVLPLNPV
jgi:DNA-binding GntR family transcriptional regulator